MSQQIPAQEETMVLEWDDNEPHMRENSQQITHRGWVENI